MYIHKGALNYRGSDSVEFLIKNTFLPAKVAQLVDYRPVYQRLWVLSLVGAPMGGTH